MATSETGTENGVGNSARCKEFSARDENFILKSTHLFIYLFIYLFIHLFSTRLTELKLSARTKNLHIIRPVDV